MCLDGISESKRNDGGQQMMPAKQPDRLLWIVVKVDSGIPVMVEAYPDEQSAKTRERSLRRDMHPENDETGVFEVQIGHPAPFSVISRG
jgi:hypothetical protein